MTNVFSYSTTFTLNKAHFQECFSNSVVVEHTLSAYRKAIIFALIGLGLIGFSNIEPYIGYFVLGLGLLEAISHYYKKPWWVARQMLSRAANSEVTLTIDDNGILTHSSYVNNRILWPDIQSTKPTQDGLILVHSKGQSYISNSCLSEQAKGFILAKTG